ncbi:MAG: 2-amino-4-hydroxy-6-hydroxymethyldihydropteridine diphosphokinase [Deltaproteobacteria bacterium]|nr:2-amino-4-hydroxy-6-hydroxymethyldihydropteridine diphosphokinase [Deltaproteobacteria bacterium]
MKEIKQVRQAYLGLGSNLGDRKGYLSKALESLKAHPQIEVGRISHFYETEPLTLNGESQNAYLNACVQVKTSLNAVQLFRVLEKIEQENGRTREYPWAPRTLDLDLLFFGDEIYRSKSLSIPHPEAHRRRFVLEPLAEIAPDYIHPIKGLSILALLKSLRHNKKVVPLYRFHFQERNEEKPKTPTHPQQLESQ